MTTVTTANMIFLGNFSAMDSDESDWDSENPEIIVGAHDDLSIVEITEFDTNEDGTIHDDEVGGTDYLSYDTGSGTTTSQLDTTAIYNANVTAGDGTITSFQVIVVQTVNGDVFVSELTSGTLDNVSIQSITLTSEESSFYGGYTANSTSVDNAQIVCFCSGTQIATPDGEVSVEDLRSGDLVRTLDHGLRPIVWTNTTTSLRPAQNAAVSIPPGSLGDGIPERTLRVSPQHRILLRSKIADRMYGTREVLVSAKTLIGFKNITQTLPFIPTSYHHFACENHEIVYANGAETETFLPGPMAIKTLPETARARLKTCHVGTAPARSIARGSKARHLVQRHINNTHRSPIEVA